MRVTPPDLELWMTGYVRREAAAARIPVEVGNKEPTDLELPLRRPLIVIRDDSGTRLDWTTFDRSLGASVLAGTRTNDKPANDIARWLAGLMFDDALPLVHGSPIASVEWGGCNGPYAVPENLDVARRYLTAQYVVAGSW
ncbi:hypothetical protein [Leucobacter massiliensis]|uniref:Uncharacterized protein n=1 Tax=Leucobacter massiliensis TaxID=1686285 RepID=A0A2S9QMV3_9MICO|nr:hypothetical protein [Leucobacter massiliensis]PRI10919.1 hypothetical protein B4915_08525 [Leucobacter massiliensis]